MGRVLFLVGAALPSCQETPRPFRYLVNSRGVPHAQPLMLAVGRGLASLMKNPKSLRPSLLISKVLKKDGFRHACFDKCPQMGVPMRHTFPELLPHLRIAGRCHYRHMRDHLPSPVHLVMISLGWYKRGRHAAIYSPSSMCASSKEENGTAIPGTMSTPPRHSGTRRVPSLRRRGCPSLLSVLDYLSRAEEAAAASSPPPPLSARGFLCFRPALRAPRPAPSLLLSIRLPAAAPSRTSASAAPSPPTTAALSCSPRRASSSAL
jgi:hypothetical protein